MAPQPKTSGKEERTLSGPQKAAILLMTIGEDHASKVLSMLDDEEIKEISSNMSSIGQVASETVERLCVEFAEAMAGTSGVAGGFDSTERLLTRALGKGKVDSIMEEIRGPAGRTTWDKLGNVSEDILAAFLKNEYPQTIALVLSKIKSDHAARVLMTLPEDVSIEVIQRMLSMEAVKKEVLENIEKTLRTEFMTNLAKTQRRDSHEMLAEIFNNLDRTAESKFMGELEKRAPESAEKVRSLMFTFEDIGKIDGPGIQSILRVADKEKLSIALKGAPENIKQLFFSNMSERAAKIMKEDMESKGPVRIKDVDEAQSIIVNLAKDMAAKGEIQINDGDPDNQMVY